MLPVPRSDAKDRREYEYLPLYYPPSVGARTLIDSSSDDNSVDFEVETNPSGKYIYNSKFNYFVILYDTLPIKIMRQALYKKTIRAPIA